MKLLNPHHRIEVWERNAADDTFGFGVVFSDETLGGIEHADTAISRSMAPKMAVSACTTGAPSPPRAATASPP